MSKFQELQDQHIRLLERHDRQKESPELLKEVKEYTEQVINASREIADSRERNQLRANLRFWGSYIYDHTKIYPNLNLLPSEGGVETLPASVRHEAQPPKSRAKIIAWIALFLLIVVAVVALPRLLLRNRPYSQALSVTNTPINPDSLFATAVGQPTGMNDVQLFATGTAIAVAIQSGTPMGNVLIGTPVLGLPTATPILLPATGGGGGEDSAMAGHAFSSIDIQDGTTCSSHSINIQILHDFAAAQPVEPATLTITEEGTGRQVEQREISLQAGDAQVELQDALGSYLVYLDHPKLTFDAVIVQHLPDCQGNVIDITYEVAADGYDELVTRPSLGLRFNLLAWGPQPAFADYGVAKLQVTSPENSGEPIFWIDAYNSGQYELIQNDEFLVESDVDYAIGVTFAGRTVSIPFRLVTPYVGYTPGE